MTTKEKITYSKLNLATLYNSVPNRFLLSIVVAKRARQIKDGAKPRIDVKIDVDADFVAIALTEIQQGLVNFDIKDQQDQDIEMIEHMEDYLDADLDTDKDYKKDIKKVKLKSLGA